MANSPNRITKSTSLADLLATAVSDGTYSDVLETAKVDAAGQEAAATDIPQFGGQLIANLWDDATKRVVQMYDRSTKVWLVADATERDALGSDDDLAANDLAFQLDTLGLNYCVSVDGGAASTWAGIAATGNVAGPGLSTDNAVARFDGAGGATLQNSVVLISDTGAITGVASIAVSGNVDGRDVSADGAVLDAHVANISNPHSTLLAQVLASGNDTAGTHVVVTNGDEINGEDGGYVRFAAGTGLVEISDASIGELTSSGSVTADGFVLNEQASGPAFAAGKVKLWAKNDSPATLWWTDDAGNEYQVAASATFSLAQVLVFGNVTDGTDMLVTDGDAIRGQDGNSGPGATVLIQGGTGDGASQLGGAINVTGGTGSVTGDGGNVSVSGGAGGSGAATGGSVTIYSGDGGGTSGNSGGITIAAGAVTSGTRGAITIDADTINLSADTNIVITSQGYHSVRGSTARGSANTLIYRWTSVVGNVGSDITYTDSATAGGSWAINRAGVYAVSVSIDVGHNGYIAIKKAAAVSNTFDATDIMVASEAATGITQTMSWTGYCAAGDDIWIATNTATNPTGTPVNNNRVTITRVR